MAHLQSSRASKFGVRRPFGGALLIFGGLLACTTRGSSQDDNLRSVVRALGSHDEAVANLAQQKLVRVGTSAIPFLLEAIESSDVGLRQRAAHVIGCMRKASGAGAVLVRRLKVEAEPSVAVAILRALGTVGAEDDVVVPALVSSALHTDPGVRSAACAALGKLNSHEEVVVAALLSAARDTNDDVVVSALRGLRQSGLSADQLSGLSGVRVPHRRGAIMDVLHLFKSAPQTLLLILRANPRLLVQLDTRIHGDCAELRELVFDEDPNLRAVREHILRDPCLPTAMMVRVGDRRYLPVIEGRIRAASAFERSFLLASARAIAGPDEAEQIARRAPPIPFVKAENSKNQGTGFRISHGKTRTLVTGRILRPDGTPGAHPRLYLIGKEGRRVRDPDLQYRADDGRFYIFATLRVAQGSLSATRSGSPTWSETLTAVVTDDGELEATMSITLDMPDVDLHVVPSK